jgi:hypothetical protein
MTLFAYVMALTTVLPLPMAAVAHNENPMNQTFVGRKKCDLDHLCIYLKWMHSNKTASVDIEG